MPRTLLSRPVQIERESFSAAGGLDQSGEEVQNRPLQPSHGNRRRLTTHRHGVRAMSAYEVERDHLLNWYNKDNRCLFKVEKNGIF